MTDLLPTVPAAPALYVPSDDAVEQYQRAGAIHLRGLLPHAVMAAVADDLESLIGRKEAQYGKAHRTHAANLVERFHALGQRLITLEKAHPGVQSAVYDAMSHMPAMHAAASHAKLVHTVRRLLSPHVMVHHRLILLMSMPENTWHLPLWHQDWYYNEGPASTLTVYAPLVPVSEENGSLLLAVGEHQRGLLPHGQFDHGYKTKWNTIDPAVAATFNNVIDTSLAPGDVLMFNSLVPHSARLNRSPNVRWVINLRFIDLEDAEFREANWRAGEIAHAREALARKQG